METLLSHLLTTANHYPDRTALQFGDHALRYGELGARILATAARLRAMGVKVGDRILICGGNTPAIPILYFAVHALGAVAVPLAPETPDHVLTALARDAAVRLAIVQKAVDGMACEVISPANATAWVPGDREIERVCCPDAVADLLYTTGTTGRKKGVVLTQANILAAARNINAFIGNGPDDREVMPLPLSHSFGLGRLRCLALAGHTLLLEPGVGAGAPLVKRLLDIKATGLALVPAGFEILRRMTGDAIGEAREHLRYVEIGSAPMKPDTRQWLMRMLPRTRICHHYGLTEATRAAFTEYHSDAHKPGTAGRATPNVEITIRDDAGRTLPAGKMGEVVVRGEMVMREYWREPTLTRETLCSRGLRTGDLGYLDADGYLFLLGRRNDLINVGGRKVIPDEVEDVLCQLDGVQDAGCIGQPDELMGECIKAYLVSDREIGRAELVAFLRLRLEEWKIPQTIERVASIPRTSSGKIQRQMLRQLQEAAWTSVP